MSYLIPKDYNKTIQSDNLMQVIGSDLSILADGENTAIEEASSYLVQKYDLSLELTDTPAWDPTVINQANSRVYLNPAAYLPATGYTVGQYTTYNGNVYKCNTNTTGAFVSNSWNLVGVQYQIFYAQYPAPVFVLIKYYQTGFTVYWKGNLYTALKSSVVLDSDDAIQYDSYSDIPPINVFPDDPKRGPSYWGTPTPYTVPAATDILNTTYWTMGDNRCQQFRTYVVDIALYYVHRRIAPRNIPELRVKAYDDAIKGLKMAAKGDITIKLPVLQPTQGARIRYGGNPKLQNRY